MTRILLACGIGASTGFMAANMRKAAKAQGLENVTAYSAYTEPRYLFTYWVREWLGLTHFFMLGS